MNAPGQDRRWQRLARAALEEVEALQRALPHPLRTRALAVPVSYEPHPDADLVKDGIAPDTLGLFSGESLADGWTSNEVLPAHIHLFLENIWDFADGDSAQYREEVRRTYLHELGHYLGLDEDDLFHRDLD